MTKTRINESELALWSQGTKYTPEELVSAYTDYVTIEKEEGREPLDEQGWCEQFLVVTAARHAARSYVEEFGEAWAESDESSDWDSVAYETANAEHDWPNGAWPVWKEAFVEETKRLARS